MSPSDLKPPYQLIAGHPSLDFVNTLDWRFREEGTEELLSSYEDLLRFAEQSKMLSTRQERQLLRTTSNVAGTRVLKRSTELREAMAEVFYAQVDGLEPSDASLRTLEQFFKAARLNQKLCWKDSRVAWAEMESEAELPLWLLSLATSDLMTSEAIHKLRACDVPDCRWLFLDTSKNHARRWCDMKI